MWEQKLARNYLHLTGMYVRRMKFAGSTLADYARMAMLVLSAIRYSDADISVRTVLTIIWA